MISGVAFSHFVILLSRLQTFACCGASRVYKRGQLCDTKQSVKADAAGYVDMWILLAFCLSYKYINIEKCI